MININDKISNEELPAFANPLLYAGLAWKHHVSKHFEDGSMPLSPNGAGKGATIFTDYEKMINYLKEDGRKWHIAELNLKDEPLIFEFGNDWMATVSRDILSEQGFKPCI